MSNVSTKEFRIGIIAVIALIVGLFAWSQSQKTKTLQSAYVFTPDHIATERPLVVDIITSKTELDTALQNSSVMNKELLSIGAAIFGGIDGYGVFPKKTLDESYLITLDSNPVNKEDFSEYSFVRDGIITAKNSYKADLIQTQGELQKVLNAKDIIDSGLADIGCIVFLSPDGFVVVQKSNVDMYIEKLEPIAQNS
jgi:hypothetical protein